MGITAAMDIGSNSIRMLVAQTDNLRLIPLYKELCSTRLAAGIGSKGVLSEKAVERTLDAVKRFKERAVSMGANNIIVAATSAVRDAQNSEDFLGEVRRLGLNVRVITGEEEAELGFLGAVCGIKNTDGGIFLADIGGGSTELALGDKKGIRMLKSLELGAVRLTEDFIKNDPVSDDQIKEVKSYVLHNIIDEAGDISVGSSKMAGIGGTITTLAAISMEMEHYDPNRIHNYVLDKNVIDAIFKMLSKSDIKSRKKVPGLQPERADIIVSGTIIVKCLMEYWGFESIRVSEWDNLEGVIYQNLILVHEDSTTIPDEKT